MELYDAMLKRKSIRKFSGKEVDAKLIDDIKNYIAALKPLCDAPSIKMILIDNSEFGEYFENSSPIHAQHYIAITSLSEPYFRENIGFMGENLIIYLTSLKIGSCWIGTLKPKGSAFELPYVITIAFGYADGELYRENLDQINRKSIDQICLVKPQNDFMTELVQAIRIAPSGINRQPWRIEPDNNSMHFYCEQPSFLTPVNSDNLKGLMPGAILKRMQGISCGASIAHFLICAKHFDKNITFSRIQGREKSYKKLTYLMSAIIEEK